MVFRTKSDFSNVLWNCMDFGKKRQLLYLPRDDQSMGKFGLAKTFLILFSPSAYVLIVPQKRMLFPLANCPSGEWIFLSFGGACLHTPSGQRFSLSLRTMGLMKKILILPWDNKAYGLRRKKNEKSFCHPSVPPSFGISCQIKSIFFFSYVHTIFFQRWIEFFQLTRLLLYISK